jgi:hypothetical protein
MVVMRKEKVQKGLYDTSCGRDICNASIPYKGEESETGRRMVSLSSVVASTSRVSGFCLGDSRR